MVLTTINNAKTCSRSTVSIGRLARCRWHAPPCTGYRWTRRRCWTRPSGTGLTDKELVEIMSDRNADGTPHDARANLAREEQEEDSPTLSSVPTTTWPPKCCADWVTIKRAIGGRWASSFSRCSTDTHLSFPSRDSLRDKRFSIGNRRFASRPSLVSREKVRTLSLAWCARKTTDWAVLQVHRLAGRTVPSERTSIWVHQCQRRWKRKWKWQRFARRCRRIDVTSLVPRYRLGQLASYTTPLPPGTQPPRRHKAL